jgi:hypothetical protein
VAPCSGCAKRSAAQPELFHDTDDPEQIVAEEKCLDAECWKSKTAETLTARENELKAQHPNLVKISASYWEQTEENKGALKNWQYKKAKKTAPGAIPALNVENGKLEYITVSAGYEHDHKKAGGMTMAEKRAGLESKRWCEVLGRLIAFVEKQKVEHFKNEETVFALAATFGTSDIEEEDWKYLHGLADMTQIAVGLWNIVKPVLTGKIRYNGPITQLPDYMQDDAKEVSALFKDDPLDELKKTVWADPDFAEPKSWGQAAGKKGKAAK